jgi:hypothetical protein
MKKTFDLPAEVSKSSLIGKKGANIKALSNECGCELKVRENKIELGRTYRSFVGEARLQERLEKEWKRLGKKKGKSSSKLLLIDARVPGGEVAWRPDGKEWTAQLLGVCSGKHCIEASDIERRFDSVLKAQKPAENVRLRVALRFGAVLFQKKPSCDNVGDLREDKSFFWKFRTEIVDPKIFEVFDFEEPERAETSFGLTLLKGKNEQVKVAVVEEADGSLELRSAYWKKNILSSCDCVCKSGRDIRIHLSESEYYPLEQLRPFVEQSSVGGNGEFVPPPNSPFKVIFVRKKTQKRYQIGNLLWDESIIESTEKIKHESHRELELTSVPFKEWQLALRRGETPDMPKIDWAQLIFEALEVTES